MGDPGWCCLRVVGPSLEPGGSLLRVLAPFLRALAAELPGRWWHMPGLWHAPEGDRPAVEIGVSPADLRRALRVGERHGRIGEAGGRPGLLRPDLFPGEVFPPCWPDLLIRGSARLVGLETDDPIRLAVLEVHRTWRGLWPHATTRRQGVRWHRRWLDAAHLTGTAHLTGAAGPIAAGGALAAVPIAPPWGPYAHRLREECKVLQPAIPEDEVSLRVSVVARLAHLQVVRILGPTALAVDLERQALSQVEAT